jgi:hypothetical protein
VSATDLQQSTIDEQGFEIRPSGPVMSRGLSQVMFNYLPDRTFDYDRGVCIAKVFELRLQEVKGIDEERLLAAIHHYVQRWGDRLDDFNLMRPELLLFARPVGVLFNLFPLAFQCGSCGRVKMFESEQAFASSNGLHGCVSCGPKARFEQLYHVLVHECGEIAGLAPRRCPQCHSTTHIALDLRGSQRARDFRWVCRACGAAAGPVQRPCRRCSDTAKAEEEDSRRPMMRVIPHRANNAYYAHHITVLNLPTEQTAILRQHPMRDTILAKAIIEERYDELSAFIEAANRPERAAGGAAPQELEELLKLATEEERPALEKYFGRLEQLRGERARRESAAVVESTDKVGEGGWLEALEYVNLHTLDRVGRSELRQEIEALHSGRGVLVDRLTSAAARIGICDVQLIKDFPVVTAVFGFTRVSFEPESTLGDSTVLTRFQGFPKPITGPAVYRRRTPIFVDDASTEAILFKLSPVAVAGWLERRGHTVPLPSLQSDRAARAWLLAQVGQPDPFVTFVGVPPLTIDVFRLVHTFAHLAIRALSQISGIERTSLAEYLFPRLSAFAVYNTKVGDTLGGLHTAFSESQEGLLEALEQDVYLRTCVYDPVCETEWDASCHACTQLSEMSCKYYNRGLSRSVLFGTRTKDSAPGFLAAP